MLVQKQRLTKTYAHLSTWLLPGIFVPEFRSCGIRPVAAFTHAVQFSLVRPSSPAVRRPLD